MQNAPPKPAEPQPGLYRHYKGNDYRVTGLALHTETREWLVVYEALYDDGGLFVRPAAMFNETVEVGGSGWRALRGPESKPPPSWLMSTNS